MLQTMYPDFESRPTQHLSHDVRHLVVAFWHKVEARAKSVLQFEIDQLFDTRHSFATLDVMSKHQSKPFALGPARPYGRSTSRPRIDRPHVCEGLPAAVGAPSSKRQAQAPGHDGLKEVIPSV